MMEETKIRRLGISVLAFSVICSAMIGAVYMFMSCYVMVGFAEYVKKGILVNLLQILLLLTYVVGFAGFIYSFIGGIRLFQRNKKGEKNAKTGVFLVIYFSCFSLLSTISIANSSRPNNNMFSHVFVTVITTLIFVAPVALPGIFIYRALNRIPNNEVIFKNNTLKE